MAIAMKFYPKAKPHSAYNRLNELACGGYVQCISSRTGYGGVWTLTDLGYREIRDDLGEMEVAGYKSEFPAHDLLSMAAMTGEWLSYTPPGVVFYSEQELRRVKPAEYPLWIPQKDDHRSDGYWRLPRLSENCSVALELERTHKSLKRYENIADFYCEHKFISGVLWITPYQGTKSRIAEKMRDYLGDDASSHWFVALDDFTKLGWQAKIRDGKPAGRSISQVMWGLAVESQSSLPGVDSRLILQTRKYPTDFSPDSIISSHGFFD